ncbi:MAG: carboxyltransferase domain-containing protein [Chthonomonas sp.]|nr:carboxyltransferase domain-containing protein [Chthonomonas sp.]
MRIEPSGPDLWIVRQFDAPAAALAAWFESQAIPGILEVTSSYETLGIWTTSEFDSESALASLNSAPEDLKVKGKHHRVAICYEMGPDLESVLRALGIDRTALIESHTTTLFRCAAVGFSPGFAYLGSVAPELSGLPRRSTPRTRVEPGSVGIVGHQCAVYPSATPGGWNLIGRTPLLMADVEGEFFPIRAGDTVQFIQIPESDFDRWAGARLGEF